MIGESRACYGGVNTRVLSVDGDGDPIVLFTGYGDSADCWRKVLIRMEAAGRRALAIDLPGFGHADPRKPGPIMPQFGALADAVIDAHGPLVLVGGSLGATIVLHAAQRNSNGIAGVVAIGDPVNAHRRVELSRYAAVRWSLPKLAAALPIPRRAVVPVFRRHLHARGRDASPEILAYWEELLSTPAHRARFINDAVQCAVEVARSHDNLKIACPVLIIHGGRDMVIPAAAGRELHTQIPGSDFVLLPASGHCPQLDNPDAIAGLLLDFCSR